MFLKKRDPAAFPSLFLTEMVIKQILCLGCNGEIVNIMNNLPECTISTITVLHSIVYIVDPDPIFDLQVSWDKVK